MLSFRGVYGTNKYKIVGHWIKSCTIILAIWICFLKLLDDDKLVSDVTNFQESMTNLCMQCTTADYDQHQLSGCTTSWSSCKVDVHIPYLYGANPAACMDHATSQARYLIRNCPPLTPNCLDCHWSGSTLVSGLVGEFTSQNWILLVYGIKY